MKRLFIGGDSRSGGSLLARLLDCPGDYLSAPLESEYMEQRNLRAFSFSEFRRTHEATAVLETEFVQKLFKFADGRLHSKQRYDDELTDFSRDALERAFRAELAQLPVGSLPEDVFRAIELAFFRTLIGDQLTPGAEPLLLTNHCSRTFVGDIGALFDVLGESSFYLHTLRDPLSQIASWKHYSHLSQGKITHAVPEHFVDEAITRWYCSVYFAARNSQAYPDRYWVRSYSDLVTHPQAFLIRLCEQLGVPFVDSMLQPTYLGQQWSGNSSFGKLAASITDETLTRYRKYLVSEEIDKIHNAVPDGVALLQGLTDADASSRLMDYCAQNLPRQLDGEDPNHYFSRERYNQLFARTQF